jgi:hypothetical protein
MKGVRTYTSKGRDYSYFRRTGRRIFNAVGTPQFLEELEAIKAEQKVVSRTLPSPGSFGSAYFDLRSDESFRRYSLRSRSNFESVLRWLPDRQRDAPLASVTVRFVHHLRDRAHRLRGVNFANITVAFVLAVIEFAVKTGQLPANKIAGRIRTIPRSKHPAPDRQRRTILANRTSAHRLTDSTKKENSKA